MKHILYFQEDRRKHENIKERHLRYKKRNLVVKNSICDENYTKPINSQLDTAEDKSAELEDTLIGVT